MQQLGMISAGGMKLLLLSAAIYAVGTLLFFIANREQGLPVFNVQEKVVFGVVVLAGLVGVYGLASGVITI